MDLLNYPTKTAQSPQGVKSRWTPRHDMQIPTKVDVSSDQRA